MPTILIVNLARNSMKVFFSETELSSELIDVIQIEQLESTKDLLQTVSIDVLVVFSDCSNPTEVKHLRQLVGTLPLLMLCAGKVEEVTSDFLDAGADAVLSSTCSNGEICATLRALARRPLKYFSESS